MSRISSDADKKTEACRVLNLLARGIHPVDGSVLSDEGCWNHPVVIRALLFAGDYLSESSAANSPLQRKSLKDIRARSGKPWSQHEDAELRKGFESLDHLRELSDRHKRSDGAIVARLVHIGLVRDRDEARRILSSRNSSVEVDLINKEN